MITLYAGAFAAVLGGFVGWQQLGMPVPATQNDLSELWQEIGSNTQLILGDKWFRLRVQLTLVEAQLARDPTNMKLIEEHTRLLVQLRDVEGKLQ